MPAHAAFATPLGEVPVDHEATRELARHAGFFVDNTVHGIEHAIEVQLPFLQIALPSPFAIVPLALGRLPKEGLEGLAGPLMGLLQARQQIGQHWLIVASTDTYHGYDAQACLENDTKLERLIAAMATEDLLAEAHSTR